MSTPSLERDGDVRILDLGDDENRFHPDWMTAVKGMLDDVAAEPGPRALVIAATGKFFSNGLDLDWLGQNTDRANDYVDEVHSLFAQVLAFPAPTAAALQGHTFAAGAMLALAADRRVMRADRGFFCLPEADINIPFTPGMSALVQAKLTPDTATEAMLTGRRYGGEDAQTAGIVSAALTENEVRSAAVELVAPHAAKDGGVQATIKQRMYADVLRALGDAEANRLG